MQEPSSILILGLGNVLQSDDGMGVHAARELAGCPFFCSDEIRVRDGGTLGLALLPEIEDARALVLIDAARFGGEPGEIRTFEGNAFEARIRSSRRSVHDVSLSELVDAALLVGALPDRRALIGVEPQSTSWGLSLTPPVEAALPRVSRALEALIARWREDPFYSTEGSHWEAAS